MMEYTDRHFRHMVRLISGRTLLYTEMVTANAIVHERDGAQSRRRESGGRGRGGSGGDDSGGGEGEASEDSERYDASYLRRFLGQGSSAPLEGPSVLQLGGSDPGTLRRAAEVVAEMTERGYCDYTALNLNCGCPSPKVAGKGQFGAALMDEPELVRDCVRGMREGLRGTAADAPVTVKCRIGTDSILRSSGGFKRAAYDSLDEEQEYSRLARFVETVASDGICTDFQVHARIAVLSKSFSPRDNRTVPPLKYRLIHRLVRDYPELTFSLNGGVESLTQARERSEECGGLAGIMVGRGYTADPWGFAMADEVLYGDAAVGEGADPPTAVGGAWSRPRNRLEVLQSYGRHADLEESMWDPVKIRRFIVKAAVPLFTGEAGAKRYRVALDKIGGLPKRMMREGTWSTDVGGVGGRTALSELILNAAADHVGEEALLRGPEESYERLVWEEGRRRDRLGKKILVVGGVSSSSLLNDVDIGGSYGKTSVAE